MSLPGAPGLRRYSAIGIAQRLFAAAAGGLGVTPRVLRGLLNYEVTHIEVRLNDHDIPEPIRILHLSDLHADGIPDDGRRLIAELRQQQADVCVITGDFVDPSRADLSAVRGLLTQIVKVAHAPMGTYAVLGNHDPSTLREVLEQLGVRVLDSGHTVSLRCDRKRFYIAGASQDLGATSGDHRHLVTYDGPLVFLVHSPDAAEAAARARADYCLCGHTHGGQVCLPSGVPVLTRTLAPRHMARGLWTWRGLRGYTSRGVGVCGQSPRLNCRPEITLHRLIGSSTTCI